MDPITRLIADPLIILDASGAVLEMNPHARALTGVAAPVAANRVFEIDQRYRRLLEDASGTSGYVIGALRVHTAAGEVQAFTAHAVVLVRGETPCFAIQLLLTKDSQFRALTEQVTALNREVRLRRRAQAQLEEALSANQTLYRELQHRVKNHLQMVLGLFAGAARETADPAHQALIHRMQSQLSAIVEAQRLMYRAEGQRGVSADLMLRRLAELIPQAAGSGVRIDCVTESVVVSNDVAFPLALIANELMLNAIKHGATAPQPTIEMHLTGLDGEARLEVRDNGVGLPAAAPERRSSGLGLVRGLCRQIGARLETDATRGACIAVTFSAGEPS